MGEAKMQRKMNVKEGSELPQRMRAKRTPQGTRTKREAQTPQTTMGTERREIRAAAEAAGEEAAGR